VEVNLGYHAANNADNFESQLIPKHQTRWVGFDNKISLYARAMNQP